MTDRVHQEGVGQPDDLDRLWTPHRMAYIRGENKPTDESAGECPFCRVPQMDDEYGLVVHRDELAYVVLNLYPYSPGHLMVCPYRHVADYTETTDAEVVAIADLTRTAMRVIRSVSGAAGLQPRYEPGRDRRRRHRRPPAPARRTALAGRPELHADHRPHQDPARAAVRHQVAAGRGLAES